MLTFHLEGEPMLHRIRTHVRRDEGASAVEYGLLIALIAGVIVLAVLFVGNSLNSKFNTTGSCVSSATSAACS
jgi:pilus assembly protein Flp/PilA